MGLEACAGLVKRAIQFGTRAAQQTNRRIHGSNRRGKGDAVFETKEEQVEKMREVEELEREED